MLPTADPLGISQIISTSLLVFFGKLLHRNMIVLLTREECGPFMLLLNSRTLSQKESKSSKIYTDQKDTLSYSNEIRSGMVSEPDKSLLTQNTPKQWLPGWREWLHRVIPQPTIRSTASCNRRMFSSTSHTSYKK